MKKLERPSLSIVAVCLTISLLLTSIILFYQQQGEHQRLHAMMDTQASQMTSNVNQALLEVYGIQSVVMGTEGNVDLSVMGQYLIHDEYSSYIRNVLIAPNGIVSQVYPLEGNEAVLGLNLYSSDNASNAEAVAAKQTGKLTVTGPYPLVQGGQAISGRIEVGIPQEDGSLYDWGLVSITLSFPEVMQITATNQLNEQGYAYCVYKADADGRYAEILNSSFQYGKHCERVYFSIQNMDFRIDAYPLGGWQNPFSAVLLFAVIFLISYLIACVATLLSKRREHLQLRASTDELTGILNRAAGQAKINQMLHSRDFQSGTFFLLDIDHFKQVNDTLGHQQGDIVLQQAAATLTTLFRSDDAVCRLGGDEFVIFLAHPEEREFLHPKVVQLLDAMRRTITHDGQTVSISSSIGIAFANEHGSTFDSLYECADKALYQSKNNGKDCYTCYSG